MGGDNIFYNNIGNYHLNFNDSVITLLDKNQDQKQMYKWSNDTLKQIDIDADVILVLLKNHYILKKNKKND